MHLLNIFLALFLANISLLDSWTTLQIFMLTLKYSAKLSKRIEKITPLIIHPDQTGFIKGQHSSTNRRRLLHLINYSYDKNLQIRILSLDAGKRLLIKLTGILYLQLYKN